MFLRSQCQIIHNDKDSPAKYLPYDLFFDDPEIRKDEQLDLLGLFHDLNNLKDGLQLDGALLQLQPTTPTRLFSHASRQNHPILSQLLLESPAAVEPSKAQQQQQQPSLRLIAAEPNVESINQRMLQIDGVLDEVIKQLQKIKSSLHKIDIS